MSHEVFRRPRVKGSRPPQWVLAPEGWEEAAADGAQKAVEQSVAPPAISAVQQGDPMSVDAERSQTLPPEVRHQTPPDHQ